MACCMQFGNQLECTSIVFIWSQHDGGNVEQRQWLKFPPKLMMPKLIKCGWRLSSDPNQPNADPIVLYIITATVPHSLVLF